MSNYTYEYSSDQGVLRPSNRNIIQANQQLNIHFTCKDIEPKRPETPIFSEHEPSGVVSLEWNTLKNVENIKVTSHPLCVHVEDTHGYSSEAYIAPDGEHPFACENILTMHYQKEDGAFVIQFSHVGDETHTNARETPKHEGLVAEDDPLMKEILKRMPPSERIKDDLKQLVRLTMDEEVVIGDEEDAIVGDSDAYVPTSNVDESGEFLEGGMEINVMLMGERPKGQQGKYFRGVVIFAGNPEEGESSTNDAQTHPYDLKKTTKHFIESIASQTHPIRVVEITYMGTQYEKLWESLCEIRRGLPEEGPRLDITVNVCIFGWDANNKSELGCFSRQFTRKFLRSSTHPRTRICLRLNRKSPSFDELLSQRNTLSINRPISEEILDHEITRVAVLEAILSTTSEYCLWEDGVDVSRVHLDLVPLTSKVYLHKKFISLPKSLSSIVIRGDNDQMFLLEEDRCYPSLGLVGKTFKHPQRINCEHFHFGHLETQYDVEEWCNLLMNCKRIDVLDIGSNCRFADDKNEQVYQKISFYSSKVKQMIVHDQQLREKIKTASRQVSVSLARMDGRLTEEDSIDSCLKALKSRITNTGELDKIAEQFLIDNQ